ncbi:MAG: hypothetical protein WD904_00450 [Dehalococcoidia bacterium]
MSDHGTNWPFLIAVAAVGIFAALRLYLYGASLGLILNFTLFAFGMIWLLWKGRR